MINRLKQIQSGKVYWIHVNNPRELEIEYLREKFHFHPLDLDDCTSVNQRPKIDVYKDYLFLILLFPRYDRSDRGIHASEVDFFIGSHYLVTVSDGKSGIVDTLFDHCLSSEISREQFMGSSVAHLLYEILHRLQEGIMPMLDHVSRDIEDLEGQLFAGAERKLVRDILTIKRNIVNFRRIMSAHKNIIKKLIAAHAESIFHVSHDLRVYYDDILDRSKEIWEVLESLKETIYALNETNDALISFKLNDIMKILMAISVSMLPATLVASIFGMNTLQSTPFINSPYGFWILLIITLGIMAAVMAFFKKKGWL